MLERAKEARKIKETFEEFIIPFNVGRVTDTKYFNGDKIVINIQDLHCHGEVQRNISKILGILDERYRIDKVYVEGGISEIDTSWIKLIDEGIRDSVIEGLVDSGRLTGAEYYAITKAKHNLLHGIENESEYKENLVRLGKILLNREETKELMPEIKKKIDGLEKTYYTRKNKTLKKLVEKNRNNKIGSLKYTKKLVKYGKKAGLFVENYKNIQNFLKQFDIQRKFSYKKINRDLKNYIAGLKSRIPYKAYRELLNKTDNLENLDELYVYLIRIARQYKINLDGEYRELGKFFRYVELNESINSIELIEEEARLISDLHQKYSESRAEREICFISDFCYYLDAYLNNRISADDYEYFKNNFDDFKLYWSKYITAGPRVSGLVYRTNHESQATSQDIYDFDPYCSLLDTFYEVNMARNKYFIQNIFKEAQEVPTPKVRLIPKVDHYKETIKTLKTAKDVIVVITGGFHTDGMVELLKDRELTHMVITPNATSDGKNAEKIYCELAKECAKLYETENRDASRRDASLFSDFSSHEPRVTNHGKINNKIAMALLSEIIHRGNPDIILHNQVLEPYLEKVRNLNQEQLRSFIISSLQLAVNQGVVWEEAIPALNRFLKQHNINASAEFRKKGEICLIIFRAKTSNNKLSIYEFEVKGKKLINKKESHNLAIPDKRLITAESFITGELDSGEKYAELVESTLQEQLPDSEKYQIYNRLVITGEDIFNGYTAYLNEKGVELKDKYSKLAGKVRSGKLIWNEKQFNELKVLLAKTPTVKNMCLDYFIDVLQGLSDEQKSLLANTKIDKHRIWLHIVEGCPNDCVICSFNASKVLKCMPLPLAIKILRELKPYKKRNNQVTPYYAGEPLSYNDSIIGASFADFVINAGKEGYDNISLVTNGLKGEEGNKKAEYILSKIPKEFFKRPIHISFHLYHKNVYEYACDKRAKLKDKGLVSDDTEERKRDLIEEYFRHYRSLIDGCIKAGTKFKFRSFYDPMIEIYSGLLTEKYPQVEETVNIIREMEQEVWQKLRDYASSKYGIKLDGIDEAYLKRWEKFKENAANRQTEDWIKINQEHIVLPIRWRGRAYGFLKALGVHDADISLMHKMFKSALILEPSINSTSGIGVSTKGSIQLFAMEGFTERFRTIGEMFASADDPHFRRFLVMLKLLLSVDMNGVKKNIINLHLKPPDSSLQAILSDMGLEELDEVTREMLLSFIVLLGDKVRKDIGLSGDEIKINRIGIEDKYLKLFHLTLSFFGDIDELRTLLNDLSSENVKNIYNKLSSIPFPISIKMGLEFEKDGPLYISGFPLITEAHPEFALRGKIDTRIFETPYAAYKKREIPDAASPEQSRRGSGMAADDGLTHSLSTTVDRLFDLVKVNAALTDGGTTEFIKEKFMEMVIGYYNGDKRKLVPEPSESILETVSVIEKATLTDIPLNYKKQKERIEAAFIKRKHEIGMPDLSDRKIAINILEGEMFFNKNHDPAFIEVKFDRVNNRIEINVSEGFMVMEALNYLAGGSESFLGRVVIHEVREGKTRLTAAKYHESITDPDEKGLIESMEQWALRLIAARKQKSFLPTLQKVAISLANALGNEDSSSNEGTNNELVKRANRGDVNPRQFAKDLVIQIEAGKLSEVHETAELIKSYIGNLYKKNRKRAVLAAKEIILVLASQTKNDRVNSKYNTFEFFLRIMGYIGEEFRVLYREAVEIYEHEAAKRSPDLDHDSIWRKAVRGSKFDINRLEAEVKGLVVINVEQITNLEHISDEEIAELIRTRVAEMSDWMPGHELLHEVQKLFFGLAMYSLYEQHTFDTVDYKLIARGVGRYFERGYCAVVDSVPDWGTKFRTYLFEAGSFGFRDFELFYEIQSFKITEKIKLSKTDEDERSIEIAIREKILEIARGHDGIEGATTFVLSLLANLCINFSGENYDIQNLAKSFRIIGKVNTIVNECFETTGRQHHGGNGNIHVYLERHMRKKIRRAVTEMAEASDEGQPLMHPSTVEKAGKINIMDWRPFKLIRESKKIFNWAAKIVAWFYERRRINDIYKLRKKSKDAETAQVREWYKKQYDDAKREFLVGHNVDGKKYDELDENFEGIMKSMDRWARWLGVGLANSIAHIRYNWRAVKEGKTPLMTKNINSAIPNPASGMARIMQIDENNSAFSRKPSKNIFEVNREIRINNEEEFSREMAFWFESDQLNRKTISVPHRSAKVEFEYDVQLEIEDTELTELLDEVLKKAEYQVLAFNARLLPSKFWILSLDKSFSLCEDGKIRWFVGINAVVNQIKDPKIRKALLKFMIFYGLLRSISKGNTDSDVVQKMLLMESFNYLKSLLSKEEIKIEDLESDLGPLLQGKEIFDVLRLISLLRKILYFSEEANDTSILMKKIILRDCETVLKRLKSDYPNAKSQINILATYIGQHSSIKSNELDKFRNKLENTIFLKIIPIMLGLSENGSNGSNGSSGHNHTPSLLANVAGRENSEIKWWKNWRWWVNLPLRIVLVGGIFPHEFGHWLEASMSGKIKEQNFQKRDLFRGMPWGTRGPPALWGLFGNLTAALVSGLSLWVFNLPYLAEVAVTYIFVANLILLILEPIISLIFKTGDTFNSKEPLKTSTVLDVGGVIDPDNIRTGRALVNLIEEIKELRDPLDYLSSDSLILSSDDYNAVLISANKIFEQYDQYLNERGLEIKRKFEKLYERLQSVDFSWNQKDFDEFRELIQFIPTIENPNEDLFIEVFEGMTDNQIRAIMGAGYAGRFSVYFTKNCSNQCSWCIYSANKGKIHQMPFPIAIKILKKVRECVSKQIKLQIYEYNEPLDYHDSTVNAAICDILKYARSIGFETGFITHGRYANKAEFVEYVMGNMEGISVDVSFRVDHRDVENYISDRLNGKMTIEEDYERRIKLIESITKRYIPLVRGYMKANNGEIPTFLDHLFQTDDGEYMENHLPEIAVILDEMNKLKEEVRNDIEETLNIKTESRSKHVYFMGKAAEFLRRHGVDEKHITYFQSLEKDYHGDVYSGDLYDAFIDAAGFVKVFAPSESLTVKNMFGSSDSDEFKMFVDIIKAFLEITDGDIDNKRLISELSDETKNTIYRLVMSWSREDKENFSKEFKTGNVDEMSETELFVVLEKLKAVISLNETIAKKYNLEFFSIIRMLGMERIKKIFETNNLKYIFDALADMPVPNSFVYYLKIHGPKGLCDIEYRYSFFNIKDPKFKCNPYKSFHQLQMPGLRVFKPREKPKQESASMNITARDGFFAGTYFGIRGLALAALHVLGEIVKILIKGTEMGALLETSAVLSVFIASVLVIFFMGRSLILAIAEKLIHGRLLNSDYDKGIIHVGPDGNIKFNLKTDEKSSSKGAIFKYSFAILGIILSLPHEVFHKLFPAGNDQEKNMSENLAYTIEAFMLTAVLSIFLKTFILSIFFSAVMIYVLVISWKGMMDNYRDISVVREIDYFARTRNVNDLIDIFDEVIEKKHKFRIIDHLGNIGRGRSVGFLFSLLRDEDDAIANRALETLRRNNMSEDQIVDEYIEILGDEDRFPINKRCVEQLVQSGNTRTVLAYCSANRNFSLLSSDNRENNSGLVREMRRDIMKKIPRCNLNELQGLINTFGINSDPELLNAEIKRLEEIDTEEAKTVLAEFLVSDSVEIRDRVSATLYGKLGDEDQKRIILPVYKRYVADNKIAIFSHLPHLFQEIDRLGDDDDVKALIPTLRHSMRHVRQSALGILRRRLLRDELIMEHRAILLERENESNVLEDAIEYLVAENDKESASIILQFVDSNAALLRMSAAEAVKKLGGITDTVERLGMVRKIDGKNLGVESDEKLEESETHLGNMLKIGDALSVLGVPMARILEARRNYLEQQVPDEKICIELFDIYSRLGFLNDVLGELSFKLPRRPNKDKFKKRPADDDRKGKSIWKSELPRVRVDLTSLNKILGFETDGNLDKEGYLKALGEYRVKMIPIVEKVKAFVPKISEERARKKIEWLLNSSLRFEAVTALVQLRQLGRAKGEKSVKSVRKVIIFTVLKMAIGLSIFGFGISYAAGLLGMVLGYKSSLFALVTGYTILSFIAGIIAGLVKARLFIGQYSELKGLDKLPEPVKKQIMQVEGIVEEFKKSHPDINVIPVDLPEDALSYAKGTDTIEVDIKKMAKLLMSKEYYDLRKIALDPISVLQHEYEHLEYRRKHSSWFYQRKTVEEIIVSWKDQRFVDRILRDNNDLYGEKLGERILARIIAKGSTLRILLLLSVINSLLTALVYPLFISNIVNTLYISLSIFSFFVAIAALSFIVKYIYGKILHNEVDRLIQILEKNRDVYWIKMAVIKYLGRTKSPRALEFLLKETKVHHYDIDRTSISIKALCKDLRNISTRKAKKMLKNRDSAIILLYYLGYRKPEVNEAIRSIFEKTGKNYKIHLDYIIKKAKNEAKQKEILFKLLKSHSRKTRDYAREKLREISISDEEYCEAHLAALRHGNGNLFIEAAGVIKRIGNEVQRKEARVFLANELKLVKAGFMQALSAIRILDSNEAKVIGLERMTKLDSPGQWRVDFTFYGNNFSKNNASSSDAIKREKKKLIDNINAIINDDLENIEKEVARHIDELCDGYDNNHDESLRVIKNYLIILKGKLEDYGINMEKNISICEVIEGIKKDLGKDILETKYIRKLRNELTTVVDENNNPVTRTDIGFVHIFGLHHRTANAIILTPDGKILLNRRVHNKDSSAKKIGIFGGHQGIDETEEECLERELMEELGLYEIDDSLDGVLTRVGERGCFISESGNNKEFRSLYIYELTEEGYEQEKRRKEILDRKRSVRSEIEFEEWIEEQQEKDGLGEEWSLIEVDLEDIEGKRAIEVTESYIDKTVTEDVEFSGSLLAPLMNGTSKIREGFPKVDPLNEIRKKVEFLRDPETPTPRTKEGRWIRYVNALIKRNFLPDLLKHIIPIFRIDLLFKIIFPKLTDLPILKIAARLANKNYFTTKNNLRDLRSMANLGMNMFSVVSSEKVVKHGDIINLGSVIVGSRVIGVEARVIKTSKGSLTYLYYDGPESTVTAMKVAEEIAGNREKRELLDIERGDFNIDIFEETGLIDPDAGKHKLYSNAFFKTVFVYDADSDNDRIPDELFDDVVSSNDILKKLHRIENLVKAKSQKGNIKGKPLFATTFESIEDLVEVDYSKGIYSEVDTFILKSSPYRPSKHKREKIITGLNSLHLKGKRAGVDFELTKPSGENNIRYEMIDKVKMGFDVIRIDVSKFTGNTKDMKRALRNLRREAMSINAQASFVVILPNNEDLFNELQLPRNEYDVVIRIPINKLMRGSNYKWALKSGIWIELSEDFKNYESEVTEKQGYWDFVERFEEIMRSNVAVVSIDNGLLNSFNSQYEKENGKKTFWEYFMGILEEKEIAKMNDPIFAYECAEKKGINDFNTKSINVDDRVEELALEILEGGRKDQLTEKRCREILEELGNAESNIPSAVIIEYTKGYCFGLLLSKYADDAEDNVLATENPFISKHHKEMYGRCLVEARLKLGIKLSGFGSVMAIIAKLNESQEGQELPQELVEIDKKINEIESQVKKNAIFDSFYDDVQVVINKLEDFIRRNGPAKYPVAVSALLYMLYTYADKDEQSAIKELRKEILDAIPMVAREIVSAG